ncbi:MFS transporter [Glaciibacter superstes]|uniref:MFS transporter n=1 Tax=Glaciibacter superstes TaxID=501023 RepID=UPI0003B44333|nr:MFS transporter [Glaciibacter superstes]
MNARAQLTWAICTQILAISCWLNTAATLPAISAEYGLGDGAASALTAAVQGGFAAGALALAIRRTTDRVRPAILISVGSLAAAVFTLLPALLEINFIWFVVSKASVGLALAAVYTTGMRVVLSWAPPRYRSLAVAALVASLTVGTAAPHLLTGSVGSGQWRALMILTAALALVAALIGLTSRTGPHVSPIREVTLSDALAVVSNPVQRRITIAYVGHMWEVYGLWVWVPSLMLSLPEITTLRGSESAAAVGGWTFVIIGVAGTIGCFVGGFLPHFSSRRLVARAVVAVSAVCVLLTPLLAVVPFWLSLGVLVVWGAATIGDSALYSAMTGRESGQAAVGTAIATQMGIGYSVSIGVVYALPLAAGLVGWQFAFLILAIGPAVSFVALRPWDRRTPITH